MRNLLSYPTILVARGCLAPYFLNWWKSQSTSLHIIDFSRWRWFEFGELANPRWIGQLPDKGPVVLFDRNTTTGQTLRILDVWLEEQGYQPIILGHMDLNMGKFGMRYLDFVWDDGEGYDKLGLACQNGNGVKILKANDFKKELKGAYTFCVIGGKRTELDGIDANGSAFDLHAEPIHGKNSIVFQNVSSWEQAMLLGYINQKPLITIAGQEGIVADYDLNNNLEEITQFLEEERQ